MLIKPLLCLPVVALLALLFFPRFRRYVPKQTWAGRKLRRFLARDRLSHIGEKKDGWHGKQ